MGVLEITLTIPACSAIPNQTRPSSKASHTASVQHVDSVFQVLLEPNAHLRSILRAEVQR